LKDKFGQQIFLIVAVTGDDPIEVSRNKRRVSAYRRERDNNVIVCRKYTKGLSQNPRLAE